MLFVLLFGLVATAAAAPHQPRRWWGRPPPPRYEDPDLSDYSIGESLFDTSRFWNDLTRDLLNIERMFEDMQKHFPSNVVLQGEEGNEYKIKIPLSGYDQNDIVVKAHEGVLMVQAVHKSQDESIEDRSFLGIRNLPAGVNINGTWIYEDGNLEIVFPLIKKAVTHEVTEGPMTTSAPDLSREEMEPHQGEDVANKNADVGLEQSKEDKNKEIETNEVPNSRQSKAKDFEATTYSVDLKDEYEFVPASY